MSWRKALFISVAYVGVATAAFAAIIIGLQLAGLASNAIYLTWAGASVVGVIAAAIHAAFRFSSMKVAVISLSLAAGSLVALWYVAAMSYISIGGGP